MPWNGSGAFSRVFGSTGWVNDRNASTLILATRHDTHDQDLSDGINLCITKDGQSKPAATITPNSHLAYDWGSLALSWSNIFARAFRAYNGGFYSSFEAGTLTSSRTIYSPNFNGPMMIGEGRKKSSDTSRSSVTTLSDDPDLIIGLDAGATYVIDIHLPFSDNWTSGTHPGIVYRLGYTGSVTNYSVCTFGVINGVSFSNTLWTNISFQNSSSGLTGGGAQDWAKINGSIITNTSGNLSVQWAQFNSTGTTTMKAGAYFKITKVS